jgi:Ca2+-binding EF-hand superfamily protein
MTVGFDARSTWVRRGFGGVGGERGCPVAGVVQRDRIGAMFAAFDADGDGLLRREDFEALAARWCALPAAGPGTELRARVERAMLGWWEQLAATADVDGDGGVDLGELLALADRLPSMPEAVRETADTIFDAVDEDGDGRISRDEHRRLIETWRGRSTEVGDVFGVLDADGDGYLGRAEFAALWYRFWVSDDPADPGTLMCGPLPGHPEGAGTGGP